MRRVAVAGTAAVLDLHRKNATEYILWMVGATQPKWKMPITLAIHPVGRRGVLTGRQGTGGTEHVHGLSCETLSTTAAPSVVVKGSVVVTK